VTLFDFQTRAIELCAFGRSDRGQRRADNQDDFLIADLSGRDGVAYLLRPDEASSGESPGRFALGPKGALIIVADGMGGPGGSVASRLASTCIHQELLGAWLNESSHTPERFALLLRRSIEEAGTRIHNHTRQNAELDGMGTTTTAVGVLDGYLYVAQVGDSRAYLVRLGEAIQLTRDQTIVQALIDAGTITEEEAETSSQRTTLLQALGTAPSVSVDMTFQEVRRGDVLVLCSDGLYRVVRPNEIAGIVRENEDIVIACGALIDLANARGGPDNITAVIVKLDGAGLESPSPDNVVGRSILVLPES
jgi:protein phosphatase